MFSKKRSAQFRNRKEPTLPTKDFEPSEKSDVAEAGPVLVLSPSADDSPPQRPATSEKPSREDPEEDISTIGLGIADLLAAEQAELVGSPADKPADASSGESRSGWTGRQSESSAYARPRNYGEEAEVAGPGTVDGRKRALSGRISARSQEREFKPCSRLQERLIARIAQAMWFPSGTGDAEREERLLDALEALQGIDPQDEMEGMLACQLIVTHRAALDCLQLSMSATIGSGDRPRIIDQVESLLTLYGRNLEILDRHRGADDQTKPSDITVADDAMLETLRTLKASNGRMVRQARH